MKRDQDVNKSHRIPTKMLIKQDGSHGRKNAFEQSMLSKDMSTQHLDDFDRHISSADGPILIEQNPRDSIED